MDVLPVFEGSIETGDHGDVVPVLFQGTHRGSELQGIDARVVQVSSLILRLVRIESTYETRQGRILFAGEKVPSEDSVREIHHDQFLIGQKVLGSSVPKGREKWHENGSPGRTNEMPSRENHVLNTLQSKESTRSISNHFFQTWNICQMGGIKGKGSPKTQPSALLYRKASEVKSERIRAFILPPLSR